MNEITTKLAPSELPTSVQSALNSLIPPEQQKAQEILRSHCLLLHKRLDDTYREKTKIENELWATKSKIRGAMTKDCYDVQTRTMSEKEFITAYNKQTRQAPTNINEMISKFCKKKDKMSSKAKKALSKKIDDAIGKMFKTDGSQITWSEGGKVQLPATKKEIEIDWAANEEVKPLIEALKVAEINEEQARLDYKSFTAKLPHPPMISWFGWY